MVNPTVKIFGITGWKNTGKTGLTERLVAGFAQSGLRVATLKHAHHSFDIDHPGTDSFRHRAAGASEVIVASAQRVAHIRELRDAPEPALPDLIDRFGAADLVLIEGFKAGPHPKIECHRATVADPLRAGTDPTIKAIASDTLTAFQGLPVLALDDTSAIATFVLDHAQPFDR